MYNISAEEWVVVFLLAITLSVNIFNMFFTLIHDQAHFELNYLVFIMKFLISLTYIFMGTGTWILISEVVRSELPFYTTRALVPIPINIFYWSMFDLLFAFASILIIFRLYSTQNPKVLTQYNIIASVFIIVLIITSTIIMLVSIFNQFYYTIYISYIFSFVFSVLVGLFFSTNSLNLYMTSRRHTSNKNPI